MTLHARPDGTLRRCESVVRELAIPAPFTLGGFGTCLQERTGRTAKLAHAVMEPGLPSGVLLRTARADHLFYEEQTSPFHQAHIVLSLAARVLLGDGSGPMIDLAFVPDVSPQLIRLMLGATSGRQVTDREAETFAFLALERARVAGSRLPLARRAVWRLRPLHSALRIAVPEAACPAAPDRSPGATFVLHRQVIEIRDAMLALRPFRDPEVAWAAARDGRAAGLAGDGLAAAVEAAVLASALRARKVGQRIPHAAVDLAWAPPGGPDLRTETACLVKVSRALGGLLRSRELVHAQAAEHGHAGTSSCVPTCGPGVR